MVTTIQDQERELSPGVIPLIGALAGFCVEGTPLQMSPITLASLDTWQLIEDQFERVYENTHGNHQLRIEVFADSSELDTTSLITCSATASGFTPCAVKRLCSKSTKSS